MQEFDLLESTCNRVTLVNGEITKRGVMCGFALLSEGLGDRVDLLLRSPDSIEILTIAIPQNFQNRPTSATLSSPEDNIEFNYVNVIQTESSSQNPSS